MGFFFIKCGQNFENVGNVGHKCGTNLQGVGTLQIGHFVLSATVGLNLSSVEFNLQSATLAHNVRSRPKHNLLACIHKR